MYMVNIAQAKSDFSRLVKAARKGEKVVICDRNVPVIELVAISAVPPKAKRPLGPARADFTLSPAFFESLPDEVQRLFEGRDT